MGTPLERDHRGYERQFAINVLGHFELTARLYPALVRANGARIINLTSRGRRAGRVIFADLNFEHTECSGMRAYVQTKTALILLTIKPDQLRKEQNIRAVAVHPGAVRTTDLLRQAGFGRCAKK